MNVLGTTDRSFEEKIKSPKFLHTSTVSELIRANLDKAFTGQDFTVHTKDDNNIHVSWVDGPTREAVASKLEAFVKNAHGWLFKDGTFLPASNESLRKDIYPEYPDKEYVQRVSYFSIRFMRFLTLESVKEIAHAFTGLHHVRPDLSYLHMGQGDSAYRLSHVAHNIRCFIDVMSDREYKSKWEYYYDKNNRYSPEQQESFGKIFNDSKNAWASLVFSYPIYHNETPVEILFEPIERRGFLRI